MKIDLNQTISKPLPPSEPATLSHGGKIIPKGGASTGNVAPHSSVTDTATLSGPSPVAGRLASVLHLSPEVRHGRVEALQSAVAAGTYQVSAERVADAMLAQATNKAR